VDLPTLAPAWQAVPSAHTDPAVPIEQSPPSAMGTTTTPQTPAQHVVPGPHGSTSQVCDAHSSLMKHGAPRPSPP